MDLGDARNWVFLVIALVILVAGFRVVTSRNVVHAALLLVVALGPPVLTVTPEMPVPALVVMVPEML